MPIRTRARHRDRDGEAAFVARSRGLLPWVGKSELELACYFAAGTVGDGEHLNLNRTAVLLEQLTGARTVRICASYGVPSSVGDHDFLLSVSIAPYFW